MVHNIVHHIFIIQDRKRLTDFIHMIRNLEIISVRKGDEKMRLLGSIGKNMHDFRVTCVEE